MNDNMADFTFYDQPKQDEVETRKLHLRSQQLQVQQMQSLGSVGSRNHSGTPDSARRKGESDSQPQPMLRNTNPSKMPSTKQPIPCESPGIEDGDEINWDGKTLRLSPGPSISSSLFDGLEADSLASFSSDDISEKNARSGIPQNRDLEDFDALITYTNDEQGQKMAQSTVQSIPDDQLGLTSAELRILRHQQQIMAQRSHQGARGDHGIGTSRPRQPTSSYASAVSSQGAPHRIILDAGNLRALSAHLDNVIRAIEKRIEDVSPSTTPGKLQLIYLS